MKNESYLLNYNTLIRTNPVLDKLQKQVCQTFGPSPDASLESLAHCHNIVSVTLSYRYYSVHLNWLNWLPFLALVGGPLVIL